MAGSDGVTQLGLHLCRGNQASRWLVSGDYRPIAKPIFQRTAAHRLLLEYDDARSGGFEPLQHVPDDKMVVLGLITTKRGELETRTNSSHASRRRAATSSASACIEPAMRFRDIDHRQQADAGAAGREARLVCDVAEGSGAERAVRRREPVDMWLWLSPADPILRHRSAPVVAGRSDHEPADARTRQGEPGGDRHDSDSRR